MGRTINLNTRLLALILSCSLALVGLGAKEVEPYKIKAAIVYHLANMVNWPSEKFENGEKSVRIGVAGSDSEGIVAILKSSLDSRQIDGKTIVVQSFADRGKLEVIYDDEAIGDFHVLYFLEDRGIVGEEALNRLARDHVLTVGESTRFLDRGGMVGLSFENGRPKIRVNLGEAKKGKLVISSELLRHAQIVNREGTE